MLFCGLPHHGTEAYLAEVERSGGRLRIAVVIGKTGHSAGHCPDGWTSL